MMEAWDLTNLKLGFYPSSTSNYLSNFVYYVILAVLKEDYKTELDLHGY